MVRLGILDNLIIALDSVVNVTEVVVADDDGADEDRYTKADTRDAKDTLSVSVRLLDEAALHSADRVDRNEGERITINFGGKCLIVETLSQLIRKNLGPDGTGDGVSEG